MGIIKGERYIPSEMSRFFSDNPYQVLGVKSSSSDEEIRTSYRKLMREYHQDLNPNDPWAGEVSRLINIAKDKIDKTRKENREWYKPKWWR